jgi:hypothetical protein
MSTGIVPAWMKRFCDDATKLFRGSLPYILNAKLAGILYAGSVGMDNSKSNRYFSKSTTLGNKLGRVLLRLQE